MHYHTHHESSDHRSARLIRLFAHPDAASRLAALREWMDGDTAVYESIVRAARMRGAHGRRRTHDAADVAHDCWLRLHARLTRGPLVIDDTDLTAGWTRFLGRVLTNRLRDLARAERAYEALRRNLQAGLCESDAVPNVGEDDARTEAQALAALDPELVPACLGAIHAGTYSTREVGRRMGMSHVAVQKRINRLRAHHGESRGRAA